MVLRLKFQLKNRIGGRCSRGRKARKGIVNLALTESPFDEDERGYKIGYYLFSLHKRR
jgi:hypothetical protein